jgi:hypothetical protein
MNFIFWEFDHLIYYLKSYNYAYEMSNNINQCL